MLNIFVDDESFKFRNIPQFLARYKFAMSVDMFLCSILKQTVTSEANFKRCKWNEAQVETG
jgi:hypothetical protein